MSALRTNLRRTGQALADPTVASPLASDVTASVRAASEAIVQGAAKGFRAGIEGWLEATKDAVPSNWEGLTWPQIFHVGELMGCTGWSLAWTPPTEVVLTMLARASLQEALDDLLMVEGRVLDDLDRLLARVDHERVADVKAPAVEALEAYRAGLFRAAQTLAAATLTAIVHDHLGHRYQREARKAFRRDFLPEDVGVQLFRTAVVLDALGIALAGFDASGRQPRLLFNRSESVHRVAEPQHSQANSLTALMLLCSVIYELASAADPLQTMAT